MPNFSLNWQVWIFGPNLPKKGVFGLKQKKWTVPWILHNQICLGAKLQLKLRILIFFGLICAKREFPVENGKIAFVRASLVVTYYTKLFYVGADRHSGILMSLLLLIAETIRRRTKTIHRRTRRDKIKKPCWRQLHISNSRMIAEKIKR